MGRRFETVSFLSDYGLADEFVGVVKSVIRSLAPHALTIDITHDVPPFDVRAGSLALVRAVQYLAPGVVLAVVDPGVGTARRAVAVEVAGGEAYLLGPDNGLLAPAVAMIGGATRAVELANAELQLPAPGATFAGRDVFAPAAAHLCNGVDVGEFGPDIDPAELLPGVVPVARVEHDTLHAEVLWVDRFGNAQLNVGPDELAELPSRTDPSEPATVRLSADASGLSRTARPVTTFGELGAGELGLVVDSYGVFALALDRRSAAAEMGVDAGTGVLLT